jgi:hypothetical protein
VAAEKLKNVGDLKNKLDWKIYEKERMKRW